MNESARGSGSGNGSSAPSSAGKDAATAANDMFLPRDPLELAVPPTRNGGGSTSGSDPVPSMTEVDVDDRKYRRSAFIPDYRRTMHTDDPYYTNEIPYMPPSAAPSTRHSVWSAEPQNDLHKMRMSGSTTSRRNSVAPIFAKKAAAEASDDAGSMWRYSSSPSKTDLTSSHSNERINGSTVRGSSLAPIFAQKAGAASPSGSPARRQSPSPAPALKSKGGLVYGHPASHNGDAPASSPTAQTDASSIASFTTARETGVPTSRRHSAGNALSTESGYTSYATHAMPPPPPPVNGVDSRPSCRYSDISALNSAYNSRSVSPVESRRSVAMGHVSRAVSPMTVHRASSPAGSRLPNGTTHSVPVTNGVANAAAHRINGGISGANSIRSSGTGAQAASPLSRNSMAAPQQQEKQQPQNLFLNTQLDQPSNNRSPTPSEKEEEMDEVIALSPAARAPVQNFRRSRSSLLLSATPDEPQPLTTLVEGQAVEVGKKYFGQNVNMDDLVANNLENAFDRL